MGIFDGLNFFKRIRNLEEEARVRDELISKLRADADEHAKFTIQHAATTEKLIDIIEKMGAQIGEVAELAVMEPPPRFIDISAEDLSIPADLNVRSERYG